MSDTGLKSDCDLFIADIEKRIINLMNSGTLINGPVYARYNRMLAYLYLQADRDLEAIYHLTESHAVTLRNSALRLLEVNKETPHFNNLPYSSFNRDYFTFNHSKLKNGPSELLEKLKTLPSEWTLVQLTLDYDEEEAWLNTDDTKMLPLHVTRLPCGEMLSKGRIPFTVEVDSYSSNRSEGTKSILEQVHQCIKDNSASGATVLEKRIIRANSDKQMKQIVGEIMTSWLKQWSCLLIGRLKDIKLQELIDSTVDKIMVTFKNQTKSNDLNEAKIDRIHNILHQVVDCCAHLSENDIEAAVDYCVQDESKYIIEAILDFKKQHTTKLMRTTRHPVLLILDDKLECVPWEMVSVLLRHPVSRVPSIHFLCALHDKHKDSVENGLVVVDETQSGFYVVNPDKDLTGCEKLVSEFLKKRKLQWLGVFGSKPTSDEALKNLSKNKVFLYCGHGNGCHIMNFRDVEKTGLTVVPLLFGCSSAAKHRVGKGGLPELYGVSDEFLLAGSPCLLGMLWTVFTSETDKLTIAFLNICLPGTPINVNDIIGHEAVDEHIKQERELLRALRPARTVVKRFMNAAAFIARGLPVAFKDIDIRPKMKKYDRK